MDYLEEMDPPNCPHRHRREGTILLQCSSRVGKGMLNSSISLTNTQKLQQQSRHCNSSQSIAAAIAARRTARLSSRSSLPSVVLTLLLILHPMQTLHRQQAKILAHSYLITWNNGPEDRYFCGKTYDDPSVNCTERQNCRSGRDDECEGYENGMKCFAETPCNSMYGGGASFVSDSTNVTGTTSNPVGGENDEASDAVPSPSGNVESTSDLPSDHWFCGFGFDDANARCKVHCPNLTGCPTGEICYFGTICDGRTPAPSTHPTPDPTTSPTNSAMPSVKASLEPSKKPVSSFSPHRYFVGFVILRTLWLRH